jgi:CRP-like cAMP-binding protein
MPIANIIENIEQNYLKLTETCKLDLTKASRVVEVNREKQLVKEGQHARNIYFIAQGSARAFYIKDGKDITDWFAFENDFICSINSFFLDTPSAHSIEVLETSTLLEISKANVLMLSEKHREFEKLEKMVITKTMLQLQQRLVSIQFESAPQKYENLLKIRKDITQRVPLTHISSYLGISLETLSRIRHPKHRI